MLALVLMLISKLIPVTYITSQQQQRLTRYPLYPMPTHIGYPPYCTYQRPSISHTPPSNALTHHIQIEAYPSVRFVKTLSRRTCC